MANQNNMSNPWPHIISLVASLLIGIDIFVFLYLFSFQVIGFIPALFISACGFILNVYLYYIDGPQSLVDFWYSKNKSLWSKIFDVISFLGALLIFIFTYFVYAEIILIYPALGFWFTPFLVTIMAFSDGIGTLTMNKSGFLHMLKNYPVGDVKSAFKTWLNAFKIYCIKKIYTGKPNLNWEAYLRLFKYIIFPIAIGFIVTFSFTKTYLFGALAIMHGSVFSFILVPLLWVCAIAFFVGEFYFVCEQNIELMNSDHMFSKENWWHLTNLGVNLIIVANALANGFVALESSFLFLSSWGMIRFIATCLQYYYVIKNKCNQYPGFEVMNNHQSGYIFKVAMIIMASLIMVYIAQLPFATMIFPGSTVMPLFVILVSFTFFFGISALSVEFLAMPTPFEISSTSLGPNCSDQLKPDTDVKSTMNTNSSEDLTSDFQENLTEDRKLKEI